MRENECTAAVAAGVACERAGESDTTSGDRAPAFHRPGGLEEAEREASDERDLADAGAEIWRALAARDGRVRRLHELAAQRLLALASSEASAGDDRECTADPGRNGAVAPWADQRLAAAGSAVLHALAAADSSERRSYVESALRELDGAIGLGD